MILILPPSDDHFQLTVGSERFDVVLSPEYSYCHCTVSHIHTFLYGRCRVYGGEIFHPGEFPVKILASVTL